MQRSKVVRASVAVVILVAGMGAVWVGLRIALGTVNPFYVVSSGSMIPTLNIGDVIVVRDGRSFEQLLVGDIIVFHEPGSKDKVIVHRVLQIQEEGNLRIVRTRGDNNPSQDRWQLLEGDYLGRVVLTVPYVGRVTGWLQPPFNYLIIVMILLVIFVTELYPRRRRTEPVQGEPGGS
jgi:signal peptidase